MTKNQGQKTICDQKIENSKFSAKNDKNSTLGRGKQIHFLLKYPNLTFSTENERNGPSGLWSWTPGRHLYSFP